MPIWGKLNKNKQIYVYKYLKTRSATLTGPFAKFLRPLFSKRTSWRLLISYTRCMISANNLYQKLFHRHFSSIFSRRRSQNSQKLCVENLIHRLLACKFTKKALAWVICFHFLMTYHDDFFRRSLGIVRTIVMNEK